MHVVDQPDFPVFNKMAMKEEMDWGKLLGAIVAAIILISIWIACGKRIITALNGDNAPNFEQRR